MGFRATSEKAHYSRAAVQALVEGKVYVGRDAKGTPMYDDAEDRCWLKVRSRIETTGLVEDQGFLSVLDLERCIDKLAAVNAAAGALVCLIRDGFEIWELRDLFKTGEDGGVGRMLHRAEAFITAELAGEDGATAYRKWGEHKRTEAEAE